MKALAEYKSVLNFPKNAEQIENIQSFTSLLHGWDSYDAEVVSEKCIQEAVQTVHDFDSIEVIVQFSVPLRDGGVQLEIEGKTHDAEIEIHPDDKNMYLIYDKAANLVEKGALGLDTIQKIKEFVTT